MYRVLKKIKIPPIINKYKEPHYVNKGEIATLGHIPNDTAIDPDFGMWLVPALLPFLHLSKIKVVWLARDPFTAAANVRTSAINDSLLGHDSMLMLLCTEALQYDKIVVFTFKKMEFSDLVMGTVA